jgi:SAM-dependent methyltransferase
MQWGGAPPSVNDRTWLDFLLGQAPIAGLTAPPMPEVEMQSQFVGSSGITAMLEANTFCTKLIAAAAELSNSVGPDTKLLDFGVGWGRLYRILLNKALPENLIGIDIDQKCVDLCQEMMPYGTFQRNETTPPLAFSNDQFDIIYAYSVFSHLAEHAFRGWLRDFHRVLKPNGLLVFTTLRGEHLAVWNRQLTGDDPWYVAALKRAGFDYDEWQLKAKRGEFLYVPTGGGDIRDGSFYGETIVTLQYLERMAWNLGYVVRVFNEGHDLPQAFVALQKIAEI